MLFYWLYDFWFTIQWHIGQVDRIIQCVHSGNKYNFDVYFLSANPMALF